MKKQLPFSLLAVISMMLLSISCKKEEADPAPANNSSCNYTTDVVAVDGTIKNVVSDSCRVFGTNYYTEHFADAGKTEAVTIIFDGTSLPAAGDYTAVNTFPAVGPGKVYVEYYTNTSAYQPASGTVSVAVSGTTRIYTFCNLSCTDGTTTKSVSLRSTCN
ncbi:MAG: hypothetical protein U0Y08_12080 [Bacteroidia bacterium]